MKTQELNSWRGGGVDWRRSVLASLKVAGVTGLMIVSAVVTKELTHRSGGLEPLARVGVEAERTVETEMGPPADAAQAPMAAVNDPLAEAAQVVPADVESVQADTSDSDAGYIDDVSIRYFNGRPVRPARTIRMKVTAYSPDERSCAGSADGITSSNHNVFTNAMRMAAADSRVLPLGSIISVPGYDEGRVIPVLDRGGAIKGRRLDLLYPTHQQARRWGVQYVDVTVWEYADGLPASDYRKVRDSRER